MSYLEFMKTDIFCCLKNKCNRSVLDNQCSSKRADHEDSIFNGPFLPATYLMCGLLLATHFVWPSLDPCVSFRTVIEQKRFRQLLFPSLYTFSSYHLTYVALSLLSLGHQMEPRYGHYKFFYMLLAVACCVNLFHCFLSWYCSRYVDFLRSALPPSPRDACYGGLSGALLTMKVILHSISPYSDYDFASFKMAVPYWFGLIMEVTHLYMYTPKSWILGHIGGVMVGLIIVNVPVAD